MCARERGQCDDRNDDDDGGPTPRLRVVRENAAQFGFSGGGGGGAVTYQLSRASRYQFRLLLDLVPIPPDADRVPSTRRPSLARRGVPSSFPASVARPYRPSSPRATDRPTGEGYYYFFFFSRARYDHVKPAPNIRRPSYTFV